MKIALTNLKKWEHDNTSHDFIISCSTGHNEFKLWDAGRLDQIEDLEMNLTDIIKQLQDYRLAQICGGE